MDASGNPTPGDIQQSPSTGAWEMWNGGSWIQVADGFDVAHMDYDPATGNVFDGAQWVGGGVAGYGSGDGSGYQAAAGQQSPDPDASPASATPTPDASQTSAAPTVDASQTPGRGGREGAGQSVPATNTDSAGNVMGPSDAGFVDPVNGQVWNGTAWYNDKAVQVDPSTPMGAPVSYYVPDGFQWNADTGSYSAEGTGQGGGNQQQPGKQGNQQQQQGNQQQQQGNPGGRQYPAPGQQNADGNWVPQVSNAAGQFGGAVANAVSPQQSWQAPQQQSWQAPQQQAPQQQQQQQAAGAGAPSRAPTGAQPGPQQQQTATGAQPAGGGTQKPGPKATGTQGAPPKKSNTGLIVAAVMTGLAVVGLGIWASWPKTPVDPKLAKKHEPPAQGGA